MTVISAAVIGGVSLSGGVGSMYADRRINCWCNLKWYGYSGINTYFQQILQAVIIFGSCIY